MVLSAQASSEDNAVLARFGREVLGSDRFYLGALGGWEGDDILRNPDNNPNRAGALAAAGGSAGSITDLLADASSGKLDGFIALAGAIAEPASALSPLRSLKTSLSFASHNTPLAEVSRWVVPVTTYAEMDGTFVNAKGMAQRFQRAVQPAAGVTPAWQALVDLAKHMNKPLGISGLAEVRGALPPTATSVAAAQPEARV
jgi:NADH-quinone oxidoreductase subunit G